MLESTFVSSTAPISVGHPFEARATCPATDALTAREVRSSSPSLPRLEPSATGDAAASEASLPPRQPTLAAAGCAPPAVTSTEANAPTVVVRVMSGGRTFELAVSRAVWLACCIGGR